MAAARRAVIVAPLISILLGCTVMASAPGEGDPTLEERLGNQQSLAGVPGSDEHLKRALALRPSSPYAWAGLAEVRYRTGVADETFELALRRARELGLHEPAVQEAVSLYGLAVWDELQDNTRAAVDDMIAAGMRRDAPRMLQIAKRRGRLDVACRHVAKTSRVSENWAQLCKSTEAK